MIRNFQGQFSAHKSSPKPEGCNLSNFLEGACQIHTELENQNPDIESFQLVYVWVQSAEGVGPSGGVLVFGGGLQKFTGPFLGN